MISYGLAWALFTIVAVFAAIGDGVNGADGIVLGCLYGLAAGFAARQVSRKD